MADQCECREPPSCASSWADPEVEQQRPPRWVRRVPASQQQSVAKSVCEWARMF